MFAPHFDGKRFFNPDAPSARGLIDVLRWKLTSGAEQSPERLDDVRPVVPPSRVDADAPRITMVNHSTVLIQMKGCNILTDPVWSDRASPFTFAGPRRKRCPGVRLSDLPPIDLILLSHNHYDHLDVRTLRALTERSRTEVVVPLNVGQVVTANGTRSVTELDWGQSAAFGPLTITAVPAQHFSARTMFDRDRSLWCGYALRTSFTFVYFAGDTAFGSHFEAIRRELGRPLVALLPIGAYLPRWIMKPVHMSPDEAIKAAAILGAEVSVAIHHGTFQLSDDGPDNAAIRLANLKGGENIHILRNGDSLQLP